MTPEEQAAWSQMTGKPYQSSSFSDYIPNVFGANPVTYQGLLGADTAAALSKQSNIAGLLGAAATLATGMGRQGAPRSALQNILGALAAGYGTAGQAYGAGIEQMSNAQKLADARMKQEAFNAFAKRYPQFAELARIDPGKAVELVTELERQKPIAEAYKNAIPAPSAAPAVSPEMAPYLVGGGDGVPVIPSAQPIPSTGDQAIAQGQGVITAPVPTEAGYEAMPKPAPTIDPMEASLRRQRDILLKANENLASIGSKQANDEVRNNLEQIKTLNTQIEQYAVGGFNFARIRDSLPEEFKNRVDSIEELAKKGTLTGDQVSLRLQKIQEEATNYQQKLDDRTNEVRRTAAELYPNTPLHKLDQNQMKRLNAVLLQRDKEARRSGATTINVGDKVLAGERAKAQSKAEENAINAQNSAAEVRAIVDILKPYRGGAWQDFAGQVGAYLPGTKLEQLATARQTAEAIRSRLAPTLRVEGSGATSNFEVDQFLKAIPSLFNTTEGREAMATYAQKLADRAAAVADIRAQLVEEGRYSIKSLQQEVAKAGLTQVFTKEDLQILGGKQAQQGGVRLSSPAAQQAYEKHAPR